jgi:hypothetical protein
MVRCISPRGSLITVALVQWAFEFHQRLLTIRRAKYLDYTRVSQSIILCSEEVLTQRVGLYEHISSGDGSHDR